MAMTHKRKAGIGRAATFKELCHLNKDDVVGDESTRPHHQRTRSEGGRSPSLAAIAIRASAAQRNASGNGYAYTGSPGSDNTISLSSPPPSSSSPSSSAPAFTLSCSSAVAASSLRSPYYLRDPSSLHSYSFPDKQWSPSNSPSTRNNNDSQYGFWGIVASKAKSILQDDDLQAPDSIRSLVVDPSSESGTGHQVHHNSFQFSEGGNKVDNTKPCKRLDAITSSLNNLGDTLGNAFEEGRKVVEHNTADIIQEARHKTAVILQENRKIQNRRRGGSTDTQDQATSWQRPSLQSVRTNSLANQETQLKASRDVAMATAVKAKVLLRELKTVKADLAFAKERCSQLEEENKRLRESRQKGDNPADDDLVRLQLETLLAEKARLAHENSVYARENRFLREIVEYHQLTKQDVVHLDDGGDEIYIGDEMVCFTPTSPASPSFFQEISSLRFTLPLEMKEYPQEDDKDVRNMKKSQLSQSRSPAERKESAQAVSSSQRMEDEQGQTSTN